MYATALFAMRWTIEAMFVASECQWTASDVTGRVTKKSFVNTTLEGPAKKGPKKKRNPCMYIL